MGFWKNLFKSEPAVEKQEPTYIHMITLTAHTDFTSEGRLAKRINHSYVLKENGNGKRTVTINTSKNSLYKECATEHPMYINVVAPWLQGAEHPSIPLYRNRYDELMQKELLL